MEEENFVFVIESYDREKNVVRERIMTCLERKSSARGILEAIMLSAREREPVICVTGKHLTPDMVYDRYILVIPNNALLVNFDEDDEEDLDIYEINGVLYEVLTVMDEKGYEATSIRKLSSGGVG